MHVRTSWLGMALALVIGIGSFAPAAEPDPVPRLLKNLQSDDVKSAASAARSLGVVFAPGKTPRDDQAEIVEALLAKLDSKLGASLRRETAAALGSIRAEAALDPLKERLQDEDVTVAVAAANAIGRILPVDAAREYLKEQGQTDSENVKAAVYDALAPLAKPEDVEFLLAGLPSSNWRTEMGAVRGLEQAVRSGAKLAPEAYHKIALVLGNETVNAADAALHFFTHTANDPGLTAVMAAAEYRGDGDEEPEGAWRTRSYALRTIRHLGLAAMKDSLPSVIRNLGDRTANVTNEARRILNELRKENIVPQHDMYPVLLSELEAAKSLPLRAGIMQEMGNEVDRQFASRVATVAAKTLTEALEDKAQWPARARAITLIGAAGHTGSVEEIASCVSDDVTDVRQACGYSLERLAPLCSDDEKAAVAELLQPLLEKATDWRKTAVAARSSGFFPQAEAVPPLITLLGHGVLNVREATADALVRMVRGENADLREQIAERLDKEITATQGAWEFGAVVLGALQRPAAIPQLTMIVQRGDWRAQTNAALAVAEIANEQKVEDEALSAALIQAAQSETLQLQEAANKALRALSRTE